MKNIFRISLYTLFLSTLLISCTNEKLATTLIPEDAFLVMSYDVESLAKKGNLEKVAEFSSFKSLESEIKSENRQFYNMLDDLQEDPLSAGIDLRDPIFMFMVSDGNSNPFMGVTMHLWDENDFSKFAKDILDMSKITNYSEKNENGFTIYSIENRINIAFNGDKALILFKEGYGGKNTLNALTNELLTLEENDNIFENDAFEDFIDNQEDINLYLSTDFISEMPQYKREIQNLPYDLSGNTLMAHLNFDDDKVNLKVNMDYNEDMEKMYDKILTGNHKVTDELLNYLPADNIAAGSFTINLEGYLDLIKDGIANDQRAMRNVQKVIDEMDLENLLTKFEGNAAMTLISVDEKEVEVNNRYSSRSYKRIQTIPEFSMVMGINDKNYMENLLRSKMGEKLEDYKGIMKMEIENYQIFLSMNNTSSLLTTNESHALSHKAGKAIENSLSDSKLAPNMKDYPFYASMDMNSDRLPEAATRGMGNRASNTLNRWNNTMDRMEYKITDKNKMEMTLYMKNDDDNSLFQIIELAENSYRDLNNR